MARETEAYGDTVADGVVRGAEGTPKLTMISFLVEYQRGMGTHPKI